MDWQARQLVEQRDVLLDKIHALQRAGELITAQSLTWAIQFHMGADHKGLFEECGNGGCRSTRLQCERWRLVAGWDSSRFEP